MSHKRIPLDRLEPERVCLIKPSSLGDVVHALPVLSALRARWPRARFSWVVNQGLRGLLDGHPDLDEVIPFDRARARLTPDGIASLSGLLLQLRKGRFDLVIDLQGLLRSGLMAWATGAAVRVGLAESREGSTRFYTHRIATIPGPTHMIDRMMMVARAFGAPAEPPRFALPSDPEADAWADRALDGLARPRLILNIGARWETKRWPPEHFAEIGRRAVETLGASLIAVGSADDRVLVRRLKEALGPLPLLDLAGKTSLPRLAALASRADLFLSNDTGPLHLAVAAGAPVVSIFLCSDPARTGPYHPEARVVATSVWCAGSLQKRCDRLDCMTELSPDRVWPVVREQLERSRGRRTHAA